MATRRSPKRKPRRVAERPRGSRYGAGLGPRYFLDSAYVVAFVNPNDDYHAAARDAATELAQNTVPLVTTHAVLFEIGNALARRPARRHAPGIIEQLLRDPTVTVLPVSSELFARGLSLFRDRPDHHWSLTDCISFIVMADYGMTDALTSDRHFVQAGFRALLRKRDAG